MIAENIPTGRAYVADDRACRAWYWHGQWIEQTPEAAARLCDSWAAKQPEY